MPMEAEVRRSRFFSVHMDVTLALLLSQNTASRFGKGHREDRGTLGGAQKHHDAVGECGGGDTLSISIQAAANNSRVSEPRAAGSEVKNPNRVIRLGF